MKTETLFKRNLTKLGFSSYEDFLKSPLWSAKHKEYRQSSRSKFCVHCLSRSYVLHHLTYERLGAELLDDLLALCRDCHETLHKLMSQQGWVRTAGEAIDLLRESRQEWNSPSKPTQGGKSLTHTLS